MVTVQEILAQWEVVGVFDFVLPFLLIFAIVFGVLSATKILGGNKGVHVIIAVVIGLLALRSGIVQQFFLEIFPRLGVGLAVIVTIVILVGVFISEDEKRYWAWGLAAVAFTTGAFGGFGYYSSTFEDYASLIIGAVLLIGLIIAVVASTSKKKQTAPWRGVPWWPEEGGG